MKKKISCLNENEKLILLGLFLLITYPLFVFPSLAKWSLINFFIYLYSSLMFIHCFLAFKNTGIQPWNIFGFSYFLGLWLNTLQLSSLQVEKNLFDLYLMLWGPSVFMLGLKFTDKISIKPFLKFNLIDKNQIYIVCIILYTVLSIYNYTQVGWRLESIRNHHSMISGDLFVVPVFSGIWATLSWVLVILSPHVKKKYAFIALMSIIIFSGVLHVKRGDIIRIFLFLIICLLSSKELLTKYTHIKKYIVLSLLITIIVIFVLFGQWRLANAGAAANTIIELTGVRVDNVYVAWLFAYLVIQFDVFSQSVAAAITIPYTMLDVHQLLTSNVTEASNTLIPINGFNAGTFFWSFYRDYGCYFFLEMMVFWLLISGLIFLSKKTGCKGSYYFICLLSLLIIFGNYFCNRAMILAIILSNIIYFISYEKKALIN